MKNFSKKIVPTIIALLATPKTADAGSTVVSNMRSRIDLMQVKLNDATPESVIGQVIQGLLGLLAVIFFILMIWGGILWMTSSGNEEKVNKAKRLIIAAIVGVSIVLTSYIISVIVILTLKPS